VGGEGFVQTARSGNLVEPPAPWSQTKIYAVDKSSTVSYQARLPSQIFLKV